MVRSSRRRKTVQARQVGDVLRVSIPATMTRAEEARFVGDMVRRMQRRKDCAAVDLRQRAATLAARHRLPVPTSVRWVDNQHWRWASCTPVEGAIRVSSRVATFPTWVLDYVLVHEMAHLAVPGHGRDFWTLVERYPRAERARGFLLAKGGEDDG